ncbi:PREDICTED: 39S ribosomal protein L23, mitochondrial [Dipodomys ordii]|uniref:Large ribosomal subunit protein uL23m n=1 Tax=Dipodomys ordii TaxID=10020 RepID=A0A1S3FIM6_DIPOR|nr:PREDICTED: 39S ribosomal protein L23, mitochondrial [Dipodomys ordii]
MSTWFSGCSLASLSIWLGCQWGQPPRGAVLLDTELAPRGLQQCLGMQCAPGLHLTTVVSPRRYPLYQLGGPQLRVFRTNFFIQLVRPGTPQPEDTVQFRIPMEMTRTDLKNYLERIYSVPVAAVRTRVQHGSNRQRDYRNVRIKKPDYKVAYVQLAHGQTFTFPDLFPEKEQDLVAEEGLQEALPQKQSSDPRRGGVPSWFGL